LWVFLEREEEGKLLREVAEKDVVNVSRYYHHKTVRVSGQDNNIRRNVRRGLDITKAINYRLEEPMLPPSTAGRRISRTGRSSIATGRKRSLSHTDALLLPRKRTCSSSPFKGGREMANRVYRRIIISDYWKPIYRLRLPINLLTALEGCIEGY